MWWFQTQKKWLIWREFFKFIFFYKSFLLKYLPFDFYLNEMEFRFKKLSEIRFKYLDLVWLLQFLGFNFWQEIIFYFKYFSQIGWGQLDHISKLTETSKKNFLNSFQSPIDEIFETSLISQEKVKWIQREWIFFVRNKKRRANLQL